MNLAVVVKVQLTMAMVNGEFTHRVGQNRRRGRRINILGVWQPHFQFDYALMLGTLKTTTFLQLMDWQAAKAERHFQQTGQLTVIILDNASVHKSQLATQQQECWQQQGLLLFFLPPGESSDEPN